MSDEAQLNEQVPPTLGQTIDAQIAKLVAERDLVDAKITALGAKKQTFVAWLEHELGAAEQSIADFFAMLRKD